MSNNFFASVRRNQKQWMVVVTVLSMVSFLFLDDFGRGKGPMSPLGGGLMIGTLVAAGMSIIGFPRGLTAEFGASGFVVGFLAGFLGFGAIGASKPLVETASKNFSRTDLDLLSHQRAKANQFVFAVARKLQNPTSPGFGPVEDSSILLQQILLADAKKMGIQVSDARVNEFLKQLTQGRLTKQDFKDCLREARLSEGELFELTKTELTCQMAKGLSEPPSYTPPISSVLYQYIPPEQQGSLRYMQQTPHQLWESYQKLTLKQSLEAVAIPVKEFTSKVPEPSEGELVAFFERHLNQRWFDEARPGFTKLPSVQLAYLTADFEKFEKSADPTDAQVLEYFEDHKDEYRILPDKSPAAQTSGNPPKQDAAESKTETPQAVEEKKPADGAPKDESTDKKNIEAKDDDPKSKCDEGAVATEKLPNENAEKAAVEKQPDTAKPNAEARNQALPALSASPETLPPPKYRELDDELKLEIREAILRQNAIKAIVAELDRAQDFMVGLGLDYDATDKDQKEGKAKAITEQLKDYAKSHKLDYRETNDLTYQDLLAEPIGTALVNRGGSDVANDVFIQLENGEPRLPLYSPHRADSKPARDSFVYWKIAQVPMQPSSLKEESVRTNAIAAWKFDQARLLAESRAKELVSKVKAEGDNLPAALSGQTVTGDKDSTSISVIETDPFTWLETSKSNPRSSQGPTISIIPLIDEVGMTFMQTVFQELGDGEVGFVADDPKAVFYVVKVMNRDAGKNDEGGVVKHGRQQQFLKEEFASMLYPFPKSAYQILAQQNQQQIEQLWARNFEETHKVEWHEGGQSAQRPRMPRRRR